MRLQTTKTTPETAYLVRQDDTLEAALMAIEANNHRSVIVVDQRRVVVGTLSDGDIRKLLLQHRLLSTPVHQVMNTNFVALRPSQERRAGTLFTQHPYLLLIPVVDERGRLQRILTAY